MQFRTTSSWPWTLAFANTKVHGHEDVVLNCIYSPALLEKLQNAIGRAEGLAQSEAEKSHMGLERKMFDYRGISGAWRAPNPNWDFAEQQTRPRGRFGDRRILIPIPPFPGSS